MGTKPPQKTTKPASQESRFSQGGLSMCEIKTGFPLSACASFPVQDQRLGKLLEIILNCNKHCTALWLLSPMPLNREAAPHPPPPAKDAQSHRIQPGPAPFKHTCASACQDYAAGGKVMRGARIFRAAFARRAYFAYIEGQASGTVNISTSLSLALKLYLSGFHEFLE